MDLNSHLPRRNCTNFFFPFVLPGDLSVSLWKKKSLFRARFRFLKPVCLFARKEDRREINEKSIMLFFFFFSPSNIVFTADKF